MNAELWMLGAELIRRAQAFCLCTVVASSGSVPRRAGATMIVTADGSSTGTLGGGIVERLAQQEALRLLENGGTLLQDYDLNDPEKEETGAVCGGTVSVFFLTWRPDRTAHVFGAGHVALATVPLLARIGYAVTVYDDSPEFASRDRFPDAARIVIGDPAELATSLALSSQDVVVVLTASHETDYAVARAFRNRYPGYLGVIGSKAKATHYREQLVAEGWSLEDISRIHTPIGLPIGSRTPEEIAVSIAAEIISWRGQSE